MHNTETRSRQGCLTCRRRHRKCDEKRPVCTLCQKSGRTCEYTSELRWTSLNHVFTVSDAPANAPSQRSGRSQRRSRRRQMQSRGHGQSQSQSDSQSDSQSRSRPSSPINQRQCNPCSREGAVTDTLHHHEHPCLPDGSEVELQSSSAAALDFNEPSTQPDSTWLDALVAYHDLAAFFAPCNDYTTSLGHNANSELLLAPTTADWFSLSSQVGHSPINHENETEDPRYQSGLELVSSTTAAPQPSLGPPPSSLATSSEEIVYNYFMTDASPRIPAFDSPGNPFRKLCRMSISYPLLLHTFLYVSAANMYNYGRGDVNIMEERRLQALQSLHSAARYLQSTKTNGQEPDMAEYRSLSVLSLREVTLAAYLVHIASEVMTGSLTTESHLQNAFQLVVELQYIDKMPESFYSRFLVQRFAMIDVAMSLLRRRKPLAPKHFVLYQQREEADACEPSFRELTGCPQPVLSFLATISVLASDVESDDATRLAEAFQLETAMRNWGAQRYPVPLTTAAQSSIALSGSVDDATALHHDYLHILNACFYWMAHLLLARRVFLDPTASCRVQLYRRYLFTLIDRLPPGCGPDSSLPIPFYLAAREAIAFSDREWVRRKHADMIAIYPDRSRELMMALTEDIWNMCDGGYLDMTHEVPLNLPWMDDDIYIRVMDSQALYFIL